ncbi:MAG: hypothetical protein BWX80_01376 [Candidatus Hydrogenedentes bacterium ADurb.Bin101]|nr:MAG: hypothetical protein BWX80_01376 [Candidatus Hydrogenedentes bacterium ADurb.Bin101]
MFQVRAVFGLSGCFLDRVQIGGFGVPRFEFNLGSGKVRICFGCGPLHGFGGLGRGRRAGRRRRLHRGGSFRCQGRHCLNHGGTGCQEWAARTAVPFVPITRRPFRWWCVKDKIFGILKLFLPPLHPFLPQDKDAFNLAFGLFPLVLVLFGHPLVICAPHIRKRCRGANLVFHILFQVIQHNQRGARCHQSVEAARFNNLFFVVLGPHHEFVQFLLGPEFPQQVAGNGIGLRKRIGFQLHRLAAAAVMQNNVRPVRQQFARDGNTPRNRAAESGQHFGNFGILDLCRQQRETGPAYGADNRLRLKTAQVEIAAAGLGRQVPQRGMGGFGIRRKGIDRTFEMTGFRFAEVADTVGEKQVKIRERFPGGR